MPNPSHSSRFYHPYDQQIQLKSRIIRWVNTDCSQTERHNCRPFGDKITVTSVPSFSNAQNLL
jgi:hypothetical protein